MSASNWRNAMNPGAARHRLSHGSSGAAGVPADSAADEGLPDYSDQSAPRWLKWIWQRVAARHVLVMLGLLVFPWVASPFFTYQIGAQSLAIGLVALSLTLLGGYGGMVSLSQMTVAGVAGYAVAIFGTSAMTEISLGWPWWVAVILAIVIATTFATFIGWLSVRTEGIYTIMITLAVGVAFFYLAQQNYGIFN
jgi:branched-chain amino acid transport system permease protein